MFPLCLCLDVIWLFYFACFAFLNLSYLSICLCIIAVAYVRSIVILGIRLFL